MFGEGRGEGERVEIINRDIVELKGSYRSEGIPGEGAGLVVRSRKRS